MSKPILLKFNKCANILSKTEKTDGIATAKMPNTARYFHLLHIFIENGGAPAVFVRDLDDAPAARKERVDDLIRAFVDDA